MERFNTIGLGQKGPSAVTIGVFDGVHLGHKGVFQELKRAAREEKGKAIVITFSNHPDELIQKTSRKLLVTLEYRLILLEREGIDTTICIPFTSELKSLSPWRFSKEILKETLDCKCLVMGFDSALGRDREGGFDEMVLIGKELGFKVKKAPPLLFRDTPISSTMIREKLEKGDLGEAWALLGRPPSFLGKVIKGEQRGKRLGFPTANLRPAKNVVLPPPGVYASRAVLGNKKWPAVLNLGKRPTFGTKETLLEVHLIGYEGPDFYGESLEVFFIEKLRNEKTFPSIEELSLRIAKDKHKAVSILKSKTID